MLNSIKFFVLTSTFLFVSFGFGQVVFTESMGTVSANTAIATHEANNGFDNIVYTMSGTGDVRQSTLSTGYTGATGLANVFLTNNGTSTFQISGISTLSCTDLELSFGAYKSTISSNMTELVVEFSTDGTSYTAVSIPAQPTGTGTANWRLITLNLPAGASGQANLRLRWQNTASGTGSPQFRIDDVTLNGNCSINPEPTNHPTNFDCSTVSSSVIDLGWTDASGGQEPDGYLIKWSDVSYAAITDPVDGSTANGVNSTTVAQGIGTASITGLTQNTTYFFKIYPYTNSGSAIDYKTNGTIQQTDCLTDVGPCISESFNNIPTGSPTNYLTRSWIGDDGFTFTTTDSRTDQLINGQSVTIRSGDFRGFGITGGIGDLTITTRRDFAGGAGNLTVSINGVDFGFIPYDGTIQTSTLSNIDVNGVFDIKITTPGNGDRITTDDLSWTCFSSPNTLSWLNLSSPNFVLECQNSATGSLDFEATGTFDAGNTIYVQLSDATGNFENPLNIGSLSTTASTGSIPFTIPTGTAAGANYRIRLFSSEPGVLSSDNAVSIDITFEPCTIDITSLSGSPFTVDCETAATGSLNFEATGTYAIGNIFTVQLSNATGSFAAPTLIGTLSGAGAEGTNPTGTINLSIAPGTASGTAYRIRVVSSDPAIIGADNGTDITINAELCPSQLPASEGLLINEFSNGPSEGLGEQEYYEFVVAGRCGETVDVRGYIIDDNNGTFTTDFSAPAGSGIAAGHLRLTNHAQWSNIPVGSLIVVYNAGDPNSTLPSDDPFDADNDSLYVIPHTFSDLVEINTTIPNATAPADSNYTPATYGSTSWTALNIRNAGDAIQVRMPDGTYFHGVSYGGPEISGGPNNMKIFNGSMTGMVGWFNSGDVFDASNWSTGDVAGNETPGLPNNTANYDWLRLMRDPLTEVCPVTPLPITLENFSGYYNGSSSELSWQTLSEQNNDYFALYHSTNGKTFDRIGKVPGSGNTSTLLDYSFEHRTPHSGINYYKLKSVDYDGTMHDKGIVAVLVEMNHVFYDQITQSIQMNYKSDYAVYGSDGRLITRVANQNAIPFSGHGIFHVIDERSGKAFKLGVW
jgi:hypothetical protein